MSPSLSLSPKTTWVLTPVPDVILHSNYIHFHCGIKGGVKVWTVWGKGGYVCVCSEGEPQHIHCFFVRQMEESEIKWGERKSGKEKTKTWGQEGERFISPVLSAPSFYLPIPLKTYIIHKVLSSLFSWTFSCLFLPEAETLKWSHSWHTPHLEGFWSPSPKRRIPWNYTHTSRRHTPQQHTIHAPLVRDREHMCVCFSLLSDIILNVNIKSPAALNTSRSLCGITVRLQCLWAEYRYKCWASGQI